MPTPTKLQNLPIVGSGDPDSTQLAHPSRFHAPFIWQDWLPFLYKQKFQFRGFKNQLQNHADFYQESNLQ